MANSNLVKVRVNATSANLGPGFDSIGVALDLYNTVWLQESDRALLYSDGIGEKLSKNSIYYQSAKSVYDLCGVPFHGIEIHQKTCIPAARGLGSSSACIVSAIFGANKLLKKPLKTQDLINLAAKLEGHPDNTTPCITGGLCCCVWDNNIVHYSRALVDYNILFCVFVPDFKSQTKEARNILPQGISHSDAAYNISRAAYLMSLFLLRDYDHLGIALGDKLHQPYRLPLIPAAQEIFQMTKELGAYGSYLSGAGPALVSVVNGKNKGFVDHARKYLKKHQKSWRLIVLHNDINGVRVQYDDKIPPIK